MPSGVKLLPLVQKSYTVKHFGEIYSFDLFSICISVSHLINLMSVSWNHGYIVCICLVISLYKTRI